MGKVKIENRYYQLHPYYNLYGADKKGHIINVNRKVPMKGNKQDNGYMKCVVRRFLQLKHKSYLVHRFIWECFYGDIPKDMVIDHINDNKEDNRLSNLQLITQQENCKKAAKNLDFPFMANNFKNARRVKAIDIETNEVTCFKSITAAEKYLGINNGIISKICRKVYGYKTGISKKNGRRYQFEFID